MHKGPVTQDWTHDLTYMQQTVLLTAVRGPDGLPKYGGVKMLLRWYRRCVLRSSLDGGRTLGVPYNEPDDTSGGSFMGPSVRWSFDVDQDWLPAMSAVVSEYLRELDAIPHHYQLHFLHAVEIVGYKHPTAQIRAWFHDLYLRLVHDMHLWPETEEQLDDRLGDDRSGWLNRADPATVA